jgi:hypothetical protein
MKYDSYDVSFIQFLKSRMDDMIIENKLRRNTTPEHSTTQTEGLRGGVFEGIWFTAFFYKHVTAYRVINFIELSNLNPKHF